ncbi:MAG: magnesium transporter [Alphaproteobacteria bacterium CG_4_9_14_3_um_filter_47_13]|nr:MAG: magnesium transporter [Alphaproteobacteria bacterium CG_4_9_14_3_um_filter_47_13]
MEAETTRRPEKEAPDKNIKDDTTEFNESGYGLTDAEILDIEDALHSGYDDALVHAISDLGAADAAELLAKVTDEDRIKLIQDHAPAFNPEVFTEMDSGLCRDSLSALSADKVAAIISELDSDDAITIIQNLEPAFQHEIIHKLSVNLRVALQEGLSFPEESAGRLMQREFVAIPQFWTVGKTIDYLRAATNDLPEEFFDVFVITPSYHVVGEIPLNRLIRSMRSVKLEHLVLEDTHPIPATMDQEHVAQLFRRENLTSAPVIDEEERLIGVITIDDVVDVIDEEAQEDILKLGGVGKGDLYHAVLLTTSSRFRWLFINLLTAILASFVIGLFGATIEQVVALAILMPIVASMGGNAGTQALTVAVRALAMRELSRSNAMRIIWKETIVGTLNGTAFATIMGIIAALWFGNSILGAVIASAMVINLIFAGLFGAGIPIILHRMGSDPAISSTVLLTTVTDVVGFLSFLGLAAIFLV